MRLAICVLLCLLLLPLTLAAERPLVLVHGTFTNALTETWCLSNANSTKIDSWSGLYDSLIGEYADGGIITPGRVECPARSSNPSVYLFTYYDACYARSNATTVYTDRLSAALELASRCAGDAEVDVVAHSFGGLLLRNYVNRGGGVPLGSVVLISVPNMGIGYFPLIIAMPACIPGPFSSWCPTEIKQMLRGSLFIRTLNTRSALPADVTTIWSPHDGIIPADGPSFVHSNRTIEVPCIHDNLFRPKACPEGYDAIRTGLGI